MENKEQSKCCEKCAVRCPEEFMENCPCHQSPHQEPVDTQKEENLNLLCECACQNCFEDNHCGNTKCGITHKDTQEPMEWEESLEKFWKDNYGNPHYQAVSVFLSSQIKQAEEREQKRIVKEISEYKNRLIATTLNGEGFNQVYDIINLINKE